MILAARALSMVFTPFYLPLLCMVALFCFSYMSLFPLAYKLLVVSMVYIFTILVPTLLIHLYRKYQGWTLRELGVKERRMIPYIMSIISYFCCYYLMSFFHMPAFMGAILMAALFIQVICALINIWWKISTHTAAIGGVAGGLLGFSFIFGFNPVNWFCVVMVVAGLVGTSRMILRQHTLSQVVCGFLVGFFIAFSTILAI